MYRLAPTNYTIVHQHPAVFSLADGAHQIAATWARERTDLITRLALSKQLHKNLFSLTKH